MARPKKEISNEQKIIESVITPSETFVKKLPELINCTKAGHPIQYNLEPRFEAIQANFEAVWKYING